MKTIEKSKSSTLHNKIVEHCKGFEFLTGNPVSVIEAGFENKKLLYVKFETERGFEVFYDSDDCFAAVIEDCDTICFFK